jgi:hypothetical protein
MCENSSRLGAQYRAEVEKEESLIAELQRRGVRISDAPRRVEVKRLLEQSNGDVRKLLEQVFSLRFGSIPKLMIALNNA